MNQPTDTIDLALELDLSNAWEGSLIRGRKTGEIYQNVQNITLILNNDPALKQLAGRNQFNNRIELLRAPYWRKITPTTKRWSDADMSHLRVHFEREYNIVGKLKIKDCFITVIDKNGFHPVRDYLDKLEWDGTPRIDTLLADYLGADDTELHRAIMRKWLVAAVSRVYEPGVEFPHVLLLQGPQRIGKTFFAKRLGKNWYGEINTVLGKEAIEAIESVWIGEISEMIATKKADIETTKSFISRNVDSARLAYAENKTDSPRQCVFIATTNSDLVLKDTTGNMRWWNVRVGVTNPGEQIDNSEAIRRRLKSMPVNQIWAEAKTYYKAGESVWLSAELEKLMNAQQHSSTDDGGYTGIIEDYLDKKIYDEWDWYRLGPYERANLINGGFKSSGIPPEATRTKVCALEIWVEALGGKLSNMRTYESERISNIMNSLPGWKRTQSNKGRKGFGAGYGRQQGWEIQ
jgi:predicted P-loop ATPase